MPYGILKCDTITFTSSGVDKSVSISGLVQNPTFSGNITSTGTISGVTIQGGTLVSGATVTGSAGQFTTATVVTGVFASGTAAAPSITFAGDTDSGFYSVGANQVGITTSGTSRLVVNSSGGLLVGTSTALTSTSPQYSKLAVIGNTLNSGASYVTLGRGSTTTFANVDVGLLMFTDNTAAHYASIECWTDGTGGSGDYPGRLVFSTTADGASSPTERLRITNDGKVGIGTSSPGGTLDVAAGNTSNYAIIANNSYSTGDQNYLQFKASSTIIGDFNRPNGTNDVEFNVGFGAIAFGTGTAGTAVERMRIRNDGEVLAGITTATGRTFSTPKIGLWNLGSNCEIGWFGGSPTPTLQFNGWWDISSDRLQFTDADYSHGVYLAQNSNAWAAYSDVRLKENITPLSNSIEAVKQLNPCSYNWKSNQAHDVGFIAQEVKAVFPEAVDGEESDFYIDEETGRFYGAMGLKTDKLIPLLTAALQEAIAKIETLEAKVAALEAS